MSLNLIGNYRDRPILLQEAGSLSRVEAGDLSRAVVLLWLAEQSWDPKQLELAVGQLASNGVLNITVAGSRTDEAFSVLLETLASPSLRKHIMTGVIDNTDVKDPIEDSPIVKDSVEEFLIGAWPSEEEFDNWAEYRIIVIGRPDLSQQVRDQVQKLTSKDGKNQRS